MTNEQLLDRILQLEVRMREFTIQRTANVVQVAPLTVTTANGYAEAVESRPDEETTQRATVRYQHSGFRSRPPKNTNAVFLLCEGGAGKAMVVAEDDGIAITLDAGEAAIYSPAAPTAIIKFDKDGNITITAASGKTVTVNGGTDNVACKGDTVNGGTVAAVAGGGPVTFTYTPPGGVAGIPSTTLALTGGVITSGSAYFKAPKG